MAHHASVATTVRVALAFANALMEGRARALQASASVPRKAARAPHARAVSEV